MILETLTVGPFACNCVILGDEVTKDCVVIDPGDNPAEILKLIEKHGLTVKGLYLSHAHLDHVLGVARMREVSGAPIAMHPADTWLYEHVTEQGEMFGIKVDPLPGVDKTLEDGETLILAGRTTTVFHTPGHSPGSVCYHVEDPDNPLVFAGDTLFAGSIGRTDLWGGDRDAIIKSIRDRLLSLDDDTTVLPGHGPASTIGIERRTNPFLA